jgi:predicted transport protein
MANLIQADDVIKDCYHFIKNTLLSYKKVKARVSWSSETFKAARIQCAKLVIKGKNLWLYLNLDPKDYADSKFFIKDLSDKPKFAEVPLGIKLRSDRSQKHAAILIADMMQKLGLEKAEREAEDFRLPHEDNEALIEKGLIKVYYSGEVTDTTNLATVDIDAMLNAEESLK